MLGNDRAAANREPAPRLGGLKRVKRLLILIFPVGLEGEEFRTLDFTRQVVAAARS
jgi:hypothetical protein